MEVSKREEHTKEDVSHRRGELSTDSKHITLEKMEWRLLGENLFMVQRIWSAAKERHAGKL